MIRVGVDGSCLLVARKTGVERYVERLVAQIISLQSENPDISFFIYMNAGSPYADKSLQEACRAFRDSVSVQQYSKRRGYNLFLPFRSLVDKLDLIHIPHPTAPRLSVVPLVITCHDVAWLHLPEDGKLVEGRMSQAPAERAIGLSNAIIADSYNTRNDLICHYGRAENDITVVYPGVDSSFQPVPTAKGYVGTKYDLTQYILYVSTLQYRKNHSRLLEAYSKLVWEHGLQETLVLVGQEGWGSANILSDLERLDLGERVRILGYVPDRDMAALYSAAELVVYPSIYEGFGLPVLEAMACGAVLAVSEVSSIPEVGGDAVLYFDPFDVSDMVRSILRGLKDRELRQSLRQRALVRSGEFTWQQMARETIEVYRRIYEHNQRDKKAGLR